jgi:hypothetical protein
MTPALIETLQQAVGLARIRHTAACEAETLARDGWLDAQLEKARAETALDAAEVALRHDLPRQ